MVASVDLETDSDSSVDLETADCEDSDRRRGFGSHVNTTFSMMFWMTMRSVQLHFFLNAPLKQLNGGLK